MALINIPHGSTWKNEGSGTEKKTPTGSEAAYSWVGVPRFKLGISQTRTMQLGYKGRSLTIALQAGIAVKSSFHPAPAIE